CAVEQVGTGHQQPDRHDARPYRPSVAARHCRRGDRVGAILSQRTLVGNGPFSAAPLSNFRVCFQGYSSRASWELARQFMTHDVTSAPIMTALRTGHSTTSSALASSVGGTVRPSALAVLRLMTNSKRDD